MTRRSGAFRALSLLLITLTLTVSIAGVASAEEYRWQVNYQHVMLDVAPSGTVSMTYQVDADIVKGTWNEVWIPATRSDMQITSVVDSTGKSHSWYIDDNQIKTQDYNLRPGDHVNLIINSTLPNFVYQSNTQGYDIVSFTPPWWDMTIADTSVKYVLPAEVNVSEVYTGTREYSGIGTEYGRTMVFFNSTRLSNNEQFDTAVSFPDRYMNSGAAVSKDDTPYYPGGSSSDDDGVIGGLFSGLCGMSGCFPLFFIGFIVIFIIVGSGNRQQYSSPVVSMDGVGVNKDLDPVEAAMLLKIDPRRILTLIMFGLMKKGNVKLVSTEPVRLELVSKKGGNYYENLFLEAIRNGTLDEDRLLTCFKVLAQRVVDKTRPFCRKDTELYYRMKIDQAWEDLKAVDTPELKLQKYDTNMFWLMADDAFAQKTPTYLKSPGWDRMAIPSYYWWYPYYFGGHPTTVPTGTGQPQQQGSFGNPQPQQPTNQTTSSVEAFANRVSDSVESMSAGVVGGIESFLGVRNEANAPPAQTAPASHGSSCACVSCACACAHCACACACAGGGGGCT